MHTTSYNPCASCLPATITIIVRHGRLRLLPQWHAHHGPRRVPSRRHCPQHGMGYGRHVGGGTVRLLAVHQQPSLFPEPFRGDGPVQYYVLLHLPRYTTASATAADIAGPATFSACSTYVHARCGRMHVGYLR